MFFICSRIYAAQCVHAPPPARGARARGRAYVCACSCAVGRGVLVGAYVFNNVNDNAAHPPHTSLCLYFPLGVVLLIPARAAVLRSPAKPVDTNHPRLSPRRASCAGRGFRCQGTRSDTRAPSASSLLFKLPRLQTPGLQASCVWRWVPAT